MEEGYSWNTLLSFRTLTNNERQLNEGIEVLIPFKTAFTSPLFCLSCGRATIFFVGSCTSNRQRNLCTKGVFRGNVRGSDFKYVLQRYFIDKWNIDFVNSTYQRLRFLYAEFFQIKFIPLNWSLSSYHTPSYISYVHVRAHDEAQVCRETCCF